MSKRGPREDQTLRLGISPGHLTPPGGLERKSAHLLVIAGPGTGQAFGLVDGALVGRGECQVRIESDDVSRTHARFHRVEGRWHVGDLGSMNGTFVNGAPVLGEVPLSEGDKIQIGSTILRFAIFDDLDASFQARMYESTLRDPLTRTFNRKYLEERIDSEFAFAVRHDTPLTLIIFDIDHFKAINDRFGHLAGDAMLVQLANRVLALIRAEDVLARLGGEEFAVLSRGTTREGARVFAERLRAAVERSGFVFEPPMGSEEASDAPSPVRSIPMTVSVGAATMPDPEIGQPLQLVAFADDALYRAKRDGRNRSRIHGLR